MKICYPQGENEHSLALGVCMISIWESRSESPPQILTHWVCKSFSFFPFAILCSCQAAFSNMLNRNTGFAIISVHNFVYHTGFLNSLLITLSFLISPYTEIVPLAFKLLQFLFLEYFSISLYAIYLCTTMKSHGFKNLNVFVLFSYMPKTGDWTEIQINTSVDSGSTFFWKGWTNGTVSYSLEDFRSLWDNNFSASACIICIFSWRWSKRGTETTFSSRKIKYSKVRKVKHFIFFHEIQMIYIAGGDSVQRLLMKEWRKLIDAAYAPLPLISYSVVILFLFLSLFLRLPKISYVQRAVKNE